MPTLLQIVHGYPPREIAGTEVYSERLTQAFSQRGWRVHVLASTRAPGLPQGTWLPEEQVGAGATIHRIVNNLPWRPLSQCEHDPHLQRACNERIAGIAPDVVHVQHLLFLDAALEFSAPTVFHLHDAWAWCARGGSLLEDGTAPCSGPQAEKCLSCYGEFARGSAVEHGLGRLAGQLSAWVETDRLHRAWKQLPARVRSLTRAGPRPKSSAADFQKRQDTLLAAYNRANLRLSPSQFLARSAEEQGMHPVSVLPHGSDTTHTQRTSRREGFVFLGSLAYHKGPDLVAKAWALAKKQDPSLPALRIVGPSVDADFVATLPPTLLEPPIPNADVPGLLSSAQALVLGSRWPENAPLVINEARASGCPVIAPDIGGIPEIVHHARDGWLYSPGDVDSLAARLLEWRTLSALPVSPPPSFQEHVDALEAHYLQLIG